MYKKYYNIMNFSQILNNKCLNDLATFFFILNKWINLNHLKRNHQIIKLLKVHNNKLIIIPKECQ